MKIHELKTYTRYLLPVMQGIKPFELRVNDRDFQVGDILHLRQWIVPEESEPGQHHYGTCSALVKVTLVLPVEEIMGMDIDPDAKPWVVMGIEVLATGGVCL